VQPKFPESVSAYFQQYNPGSNGASKQPVSPYPGEVVERDQAVMKMMLWVS